MTNKHNDNQALLTDRFYDRSSRSDLAGFKALLTRFAVRDELSGNPNTSWISARTKIFRDVCLPSVLSQKLRPDLWLLGCYEGDRPDLAELEHLIAPHSWIKIAWQGAGESKAEQAGSCFARYLKTATETTSVSHILTARVDNDDALGTGFFKLMSEYAAAVLKHRPERDFWLSPPVGAQARDGRYFYYMHTRPHFLLRCVDMEAFSSDPRLHALSLNHGHIFAGDRNVYVPITDKPIWLQYVHGANLLNRPLPGLPEVAHVEAANAWFGLSSPPGAPEKLQRSCSSFLIRSFRRAAASAMRAFMMANAVISGKSKAKSTPDPSQGG